MLAVVHFDPATAFLSCCIVFVVMGTADGKTVCKAQRPKCGDCVIRHLCDVGTGRQTLADQSPAKSPKRPTLVPPRSPTAVDAKMLLAALAKVRSGELALDVKPALQS
jgi:adenine-specific DNA glycosylase